MSRRGEKLVLGMSKTRLKNLAVAGSLSTFVGSVYFYTMKAVGGSDDLQLAVDTFEREKATKSQSAPSTT